MLSGATLASPSFAPNGTVLTFVLAVEDVLEDGEGHDVDDEHAVDRRGNEGRGGAEVGGDQQARHEQRKDERDVDRGGERAKLPPKHPEVEAVRNEVGSGAGEMSAHNNTTTRGPFPNSQTHSRKPRLPFKIRIRAMLENMAKLT